MGARKCVCAVLATALVLVASILTAPPASADVYTTPGDQVVNGREWRTWCERYSQTARCHTYIKATTVLYANGLYYRQYWWTFNNLTYTTAPRSMWTGNPLATPGEHVINGRNWVTECNTPNTGNGCRSYVWATVVEAVASGSGWTYRKVNKLVFNNIVQFGPLRTDLDTLVLWRPPTETPPPPPAPPPPTGIYNHQRGPNWTDRVTLTFDDCPLSLTAFRATVVAAEQLGVGIVMFPTGNCITAGKFDAAYARAHGHYVFNHTISHPYLTSLTRAGVRYQLGAPGVVTTYGRPPFGAHNETVRAAYADVGMRMWTWNKDSLDYNGKTSASVVSYVVNYVNRGESVLMHMQWNGFNGNAIRQMRDGLAARGIGVCRNHPGTTPVAPMAMDC